MKIAIIDNYDSFTYNLYHLTNELGAEVEVIRNDIYQLDELDRFDKLIFSPGPGIPSQAGKMNETIRHFASTKPMLGVCLGEQAIGEVFGAQLTNLDHVYHGIQSTIQQQDTDYIFNGLPNHFLVGRYHSWVVDSQNFPKELSITATSQEGYIMALKHNLYDIHGIQFHPESILTPFGKKIVSNFLFH